MFRARILAAVVVLGAFAAFAASPADAARPGLGFPEVLTTQHFQIHYTGDLVDPARITHQQAGDLGQLAEQAYATEVTGWGYPAPLDDGDGKIDVWVESMGSPSVLGFADLDGPAPSSGWIALGPGSVGLEHVIAHELFHVIQFGIWFPADTWLFEGSAEWVGFDADGFSDYAGGALADSLAQPDMSLNCVTDACGADVYEISGYSRWSFFEYLAERFGNNFLKDVFVAGALLGSPPPETAIASALAAKGTNLSDVYSDYTTHVLAGNFQAEALKGLPPTAFSTDETGTKTQALGVGHVAVNHLAVRFLQFTRGTSGDLGQCFAATLALTVALPAGIGSKPYFYSTGVSASAIPLTISGNTASLSVPWDTCAGGADGYLSLPNPSLASDSQVFTLSASLTVNLSSPATPTPPPDPLDAGPGGVVASPTADLAPSIYVYGAQIIRVSAPDRMVRLIVFSSGSGMLRAAAGTTNLGSYQLRAGNNDIRFKLPQSLVDSLRKPAGARAGNASLLTLTSLSPAGTAGTIVSRKLTIVKPPAPKKPAPKH